MWHREFLLGDDEMMGLGMTRISWQVCKFVKMRPSIIGQLDSASYQAWSSLAKWMTSPLLIRKTGSGPRHKMENFNLKQRGSSTAAWVAGKLLFGKLSSIVFLRPCIPRHPVIFSADDCDVQSPPQHRIWVPLPFSEGDWIPRVCFSFCLEDGTQPCAMCFFFFCEVFEWPPAWMLGSCCAAFCL